MWALRRVSISTKNRGFSIWPSQICCVKTEIARCYMDNYNAEFIEPQEIPADGLHSFRRFYSKASNFWKLSVEVRGYSSQADSKNGEEDEDLEEGFSELEGPTVSGAILEDNAGDENDDELISGPELSEEESSDDGIQGTQNELEVIDNETGVAEKLSSRKMGTSALARAILDAPASSLGKFLDKWVAEGNEATRLEVLSAMLTLRKRRLYGKALQLSEWLESKKLLDFGERDYASRLDLIAKVRGIYKAESYIPHIPESFRSELLYRTLLANCVSVSNVKKSEEVFNKMKDLEFPVTCFACNQLLLLYKRVDKKKIADVLLLMEKEDIKPSLFTYQVLIDAKGQSNDIAGMEQIVETLKAEGMEPNTQIQSILARYYVAGGLTDKAEAVLKEMEGDNIEKNRWACRPLLPLYAALGKTDEVERIWRVCESNPRLEECTAAIEAWGKLKRIDEAEAVFDKLVKKVKNPSAKHYSVLLKVYAQHKMLAKGKDLVKQMAESGSAIGPLTWDALVKLYIDAGEVEKADSILHKAAEKRRGKPMFSSYMAVMDQYAKRGDIHNAEKLFHRMRQVGYVSRFRQYESLIQAYINAKAPAYGFSERMKADNIFPNKALAAQLAQVNAFRKTALSDLLD
ncbi:pentatricopeptide repeat-containing protein At1g80270, mitochondrial-like [Olea europaea var. sylvestris]|uniref:pentatricopeptide repeat-containing protein At1g80270, mitochondrial-like n=1 Tax=Olea europaea var. sylvestris TaxID=158386 RepID=UPI000C1D7A5F|nr:pentatricopeptide repeat-containing protein At1g80270, mitochondrial-like [Olea europaea var. sylvestris]